MISRFPSLSGHRVSGVWRSLVKIRRKFAAYRPEYRKLLRLGLPVMVTQLGVIVVSFADTLMVAHCGTRELGAAAFVNSIFMVAIVMLFGFAAGLTPLVGALYTSRRGAVGSMMKAGVAVNFLMALLFTLVLGGIYFLLPYMGQPEELMVLARPYYLVMLGTLIPLAIFNAFQQTSNGCTDTSMPMWLVLGANALNIFGNYILIWGNWGAPRLGLTGAGLATLAARWAAMFAILAIYGLTRKRGEYRQGWRRSTWRECRPDSWMVTKTSVPVMLQSGVECFLWSFGGIVCGWYGTIQLASYQVVNTVAQLGFMTYMGFGVATSIRVANLCGKEDYAGVRRITSAGMHLIILLATLASVGFFLFFKPLVGFFTPDAEVVAGAMPLLLPLILYQYMDATQLTYANALRGTGRVNPLFVSAAVSYIGVGIPFMLLFAKGMEMMNVGVFYSFSIALGVAAGMYIWYFRQTIGRRERGN